MPLLAIVPGIPNVAPVVPPEALVASSFVPWVLIVVLVVTLFLVWLRKLFQRLHQMQSAFTKVLLLVTVPKDSARDQEEHVTQDSVREDIAVAETLFAAIGGMRAERGLRSWLWGRQDHLALEMVASKGLISFYVVVPKHLVRYIEQHIEAQYPEAQIEEVHGYNVFVPHGVEVGASLAFQKSFPFPIKTYREIDSDPLSAITNALSRLHQNGAAIQIVVRSAKRSWHWYGQKIATEMHQGKTLQEALRKGSPSFWKRLASELGGSSKKKSKDEPLKQRQLTALEQEMLKRIEEKTSKAGLDANIRVIVSAPTKEEADHYLRDILNSFNQYNLYQYGNGFHAVRPRNQTRLMKNFIYRHYSPSERVIINTEEAASLFHFPLPRTETANIRWLRAKKAPAPANLPEDGVIIGKNIYRGRETLIHMEVPDRERHMYIVGQTGTGKSVYMGEIAKQDIIRGEGVCVIDPHGSLVDDILECIPKERMDDVIYFDPSDTERPIGLNMLEASTAAEMDFVTQEMISIFYKLVTDPSMIGPMFEHNMRNAMFTLMADQEYPGTIAEVPRIFTDPDFQKYKVGKVTDPMVRQFWEKEMAKTSDFHKSEMLGYIISKVGRFVENGMVRNIIGQTTSGWNFREVMDQGKILLVNLSKGKVGEINSNLLGLIIVSKLQMAAFSRADTAPDKVRDFYLYIDEFQNFVTDSIATILSEARKYKLNLVMAHQYLGQLKQGQDTKILDAVLGNVGTLVSFRIGVEDAETVAKQFAPVFNEYDLVNVDKRHAYLKMLVRNTIQRPFDIETMPLTFGDKKRAELLKQYSRLKYGRDRRLVEAEIFERSKLGEKAKPVTMPVEPSR